MWDSLGLPVSYFDKNSYRHGTLNLRSHRFAIELSREEQSLRWYLAGGLNVPDGAPQRDRRVPKINGLYLSGDLGCEGWNKSQ